MNSLTRVNSLLPLNVNAELCEDNSITAAELDELAFVESILDLSEERSALAAKKTAQAFAEFTVLVGQLMRDYEKNILDLEVCVIESESQLRERDKLHNAEMANYTKKIQENDSEFRQREQQMVLDSRKVTERWNEIMAKQQKMVDVAIQAIKKGEETTIALENQKASTRQNTLKQTCREGVAVAVTMINNIIAGLANTIASGNVPAEAANRFIPQVNAAKAYVASLRKRIENL